MRNLNTAISGYFFGSRLAAGYSVLFSRGLFFAICALLCVTAASKVSAQTPLVTATFYQDPADQALDSAQSFVVVNFDNGPGGIDNPSSDYLFQYDWNPATTQTGWQMVSTIFTPITVPSLVSGTIDATYYPSFAEHYIDGFTYSGNTQDDTNEVYNPSLPYSYWNYYQSSSLQQAIGGNWVFPYTGADSEVLANGSVDGYIWQAGSATPIVPLVQNAPAPEADTAVGMSAGLMAICLTAFLGIRRRYVNCSAR